MAAPSESAARVASPSTDAGAGDLAPTLDVQLAYDRWATRQLIDRSRALTEDELHRPFAIGLGSLHDTLVHTIGAMHRWTARIASRSVPSRAEGRFTPDQLEAMLDRAADGFESLVRRLSKEGRLRDTIELREWSELPLTLTVATTIAHVLNHSTHHRAQALNILRQLGRNDPELELDTIVWELTARARR